VAPTVVEEPGPVKPKTRVNVVVDPRNARAREMMREIGDTIVALGLAAIT